MFSDIDHSHPEVIADLDNWGEWILKETGAGGFRFDAIKVSAITVLLARSRLI